MNWHRLSMRTSGNIISMEMMGNVKYKETRAVTIGEGSRFLIVEDRRE